MSIQNDKLMNLADGKLLYDDLRGRGEQTDAEVSQLKNALEYTEVTSVNKWNPSEQATGKKISSATATRGELEDDSTFNTSGFIIAVQGDVIRWDYTNTDVYEGTTLTRGTSAFRIAEYSSDKSCLLVTSNWTSLPYTVQNANTAYIRVSVSARATNSIMFGDSSTSQVTFVPYYDIIKLDKLEEIITFNCNQTSINKWNPEDETRNADISSRTKTGLFKGDVIEGNYNVSGMIPASKGNKVSFYYSNASTSGSSPTSMAIGASLFKVAEYAKDGTCLLVTDNWARLPYEVQDENTYFIRCVTTDFNWNMLILDDNDIRQKAFIPFLPNLNLQAGNKLRIDVLEKNFADIPNDAEVIVPSHLYGVVGQEINVYKENLVLYNRLRSLAYIHTRIPNSQQDDSRTIWTPTADELTESNIVFEVFRYGTNKTPEEKPVTVCSVPKDTGSGSIKVLVLGDSKVDNGYVTYHFLHNFDDDNMECTLLGTRYDWTQDNRNEGYGGKTAKWFCTDSGSPFCNNGNFDFDNYLSVNSISTPDYVFINLGTNDCGGMPGSNDAFLTEFVSYIQEMITSIHAVSADIVVAVGMCEGCATVLDTSNSQFLVWDLNQKISRLHKATITAFDNRQDENIYVCPMYMGMDLTQDYNMTEVPLSKRDGDMNDGQGDGKTRMQITDRVHQSRVGYWKNADYMYALVKYITAKSLVS